MNNLDEIYSAEWYEHDFRDLQPEFNLVADAIGREFGPSLAVADVGCGPGMILSRLASVWNCEVVGVEGSVHGIDYAYKACPEIAPRIYRHDLRTLELIPRPKGFSVPLLIDLVICTEVAEHLEKENAAHLVKLLCEPQCPILFTAAPPGQDGHHHVNCQPQGYWTMLFAKHGAVLDRQRTDRLKERWWALERLSHMTRNVMVLS